jgi:hypothetical protein
MQQSLQKPISEEPQTSEQMMGKALLMWRLKCLFRGRNSITTAILLYSLTWIGLQYGITYILQAFQIDPGNNSQYGRLICFISLMFGSSSLISAYVTAKISPKWSTFAIGLFSGGLLSYLANVIFFGIKNGDTAMCIFPVAFLLSNFFAFLLARKIRNKHFGIVKQKKSNEKLV